MYMDSEMYDNKMIDNSKPRKGRYTRKPKNVEEKKEVRKTRGFSFPNDKFSCNAETLDEAIMLLEQHKRKIYKFN